MNFRHVLCLAGLCVLFSSCMSSRNNPNPVDLYEAALRERPGARLEGQAERAALDRLRNYLAHLMDPATRERTADVYSEDAYFYDTLKTKVGVAAIRKYFDATAANADAVRVEFQDVAKSGTDYYLRWTMEIEFKKFHRGKAFRSVGITHLRFDENGRVILHHDYWDAASGFFEQVPVLGGGIRWIKSLL